MPTGNPAFFQCTKCRIKKGAVYGSLSWQIYNHHGSRDRVILTGKKRPRRNADKYPTGSMSRIERQYKCLDCEHVGWSRHSDLERKNDNTK